MDRTLCIWDAFCRGDSDLVRRLLEQEVFFIVFTVEVCWTELTPDPAGKKMVYSFLEELINRLERNGNVTTEIETDGQTRVYDCAEMCRTLLPRFSNGETAEP
jgi:hypothetical protein